MVGSSINKYCTNCTQCTAKGAHNNSLSPHCNLFWGLQGLVLQSLGEIVSILLERRLDQLHIGPQVRGEVGVCLCDSLKGGLGCRRTSRQCAGIPGKKTHSTNVSQQTSASQLTEIAQCGCLTTSTGVAVLDPCHLQQFLWHSSSHDPSTTRSRDESYQHTATLSSHLEKKKSPVQVTFS